MQIITADQFKIVPWKNGQGFTRELFKIEDPNDSSAFLFRLSQATVTQDGPFSIFPNIDRTLYLISGMGLNLDINGRNHKLTQEKEIQFQGEDKISCHLMNGPCEDFNIMVRRGWKNLKSQRFHLKQNDVMTSLNQSYLYLIAGAVRVGQDTVSTESLIIIEGVMEIHILGATEFILTTITDINTPS